MYIKLSMYNHILFLSYWVVNLLSIYILGEVFAIKEIQLGSYRFNSIEASIYSGFCLTFLVWVWWDFALARRFDLNNKFTKFGFFFFVNMFSIWALSTFNNISGIRVENMLWILIMALIMTTFQKIAWTIVVDKGFMR